MELYRKHRPAAFDDVKGQQAAVGVLKGWIAQNSIPHAILLDGHTGSGKTTLARILAGVLGARPPYYEELNLGEAGGIDVIRRISDKIGVRPIAGCNRVWILDEAHSVTTAGQQGLLKVLEDAPEYAYFILCTTDPQKLIPTVLNRCSRVTVKSIDDKSIGDIIDRVVKEENREIPPEVREKIIEYAGGSGRKALTKLQAVLAATQAANMLKVIEEEEQLQRTTKEILDILTSGDKKDWKTIAKIYDAIPDTPEDIRRAIMNWLASALTKGWAREVPPILVYNLMRVFERNTYDSGKAQLTLLLYEAYLEKEKYFKAVNK